MVIYVFVDARWVSTAVIQEKEHSAQLVEQRHTFELGWNILTFTLINWVGHYDLRVFATHPRSFEGRQPYLLGRLVYPNRNFGGIYQL